MWTSKDWWLKSSVTWQRWISWWQRQWWGPIRQPWWITEWSKWCCWTFWWKVAQVPPAKKSRSKIVSAALSIHVHRSMHPFSHKFTNIQKFFFRWVPWGWEKNCWVEKWYHADLKLLVMRPMAPENIDGNGSLSVLAGPYHESYGHIVNLAFY